MVSRAKAMSPILFDLDGTVTDPKPGFLASVNYALEALGEPLRSEEELVHFIGPPLRGTFATLLESEDVARIEKGVELYRERLNNGGMYEAQVYPGMRAVLSDLKSKGVPLFIATGKPRCVATKVVEHFELSEFFEKVYGAELDGRFVDKADLISHLYGEQGLPLREGIMIGDTAFDIRAGRLNGLSTIGVTWGYGTNDEMKAEGVGRIVEDVAELETVIHEAIEA